MVKKVSSPTPPDDNNSGFNSKAAIEAYAKSGNQHRDYSNLVPGISGRPAYNFLLISLYPNHRIGNLENSLL